MRLSSTPTRIREYVAGDYARAYMCVRHALNKGRSSFVNYRTVLHEESEDSTRLTACDSHVLLRTEVRHEVIGDQKFVGADFDGRRRLISDPDGRLVTLLTFILADAPGKERSDGEPPLLRVSEVVLADQGELFTINAYRYEYGNEALDVPWFEADDYPDFSAVIVSKKDRPDIVENGQDPNEPEERWTFGDAFMKFSKAAAMGLWVGFDTPNYSDRCVSAQIVLDAVEGRKWTVEALIARQSQDFPSAPSTDDGYEPMEGEDPLPLGDGVTVTVDGVPATKADLNKVVAKALGIGAKKKFVKDLEDEIEPADLPEQLDGELLVDEDDLALADSPF
jgi:hypothetical protein